MSSEDSVVEEGSMEESVVIDYINWKGKRGLRTIHPRQIFFGSNEWHPEAQWLLEACDLDRQADRIFALSHVKSWKPAGESS